MKMNKTKQAFNTVTWRDNKESVPFVHSTCHTFMMIGKETLARVEEHTHLGQTISANQAHKKETQTELERDGALLIRKKSNIIKSNLPQNGAQQVCPAGTNVRFTDLAPHKTSRKKA